MLELMENFIINNKSQSNINLKYLFNLKNELYYKLRVDNIFFNFDRNQMHEALLYLSRATKSVTSC